MEAPNVSHLEDTPMTLADEQNEDDPHHENGQASIIVRLPLPPTMRDLR